MFLEEVKKLNPNVNMGVQKAKIEEDSPITNNDNLWENSDAIICALDYRLSKSYINNQSLWHEKPMLCCVAHSLKCASQTSLPRISEGYSENPILKPKKYESSTIWKFPY